MADRWTCHQFGPLLWDCLQPWVCRATLFTSKWEWSWQFRILLARRRREQLPVKAIYCPSCRRIDLPTGDSV